VQPDLKKRGKMKKQKPRIAVISTFPPEECGTAEYVAALLKEYGKQGGEYDVISFAACDYGDARVKPLLDNSKIESFAKAADYIAEAGFEWALVEFEYVSYNPAGIALLLSLLKARGVKVIVDYHRVVPYEHLPYGPAFRLFHAIASKASAYSITHTGDAKKRLEKYSLFRHPVEYVPLPILDYGAKRKKAGKRLELLCFGFIMLTATVKRRIPPAMRNAPRLTPKTWKRKNPVMEKNNRIMMEYRMDRLAICIFRR